MVKRFLWAMALTFVLAGPLARTYAAEEHSATATGATAAHPGAAEHQPEPLMPDPLKATTITSGLWVIAIFLIVLASLILLIPVTASLGSQLAVGAPVTLLSLLIRFLELFVGFLQAYIFTFLATLFIASAVAPEH